MFDVIVRGGTIVDGTGLPRFRGDVGVRDGRIASVGRPLADATAAVVVDAAGKVVAPGFVDPHTHYDAQLCFDPLAKPSLEHGVTTVVTGNCSLSLAPLRAHQRDRFSRMYRLIEEMPASAFELGVDWRWGEGFDAMVETLAGDLGVNLAPLVGHSVLRLYVMGDDCSRAATPAEVSAMADALRACLDAGAAGLSTSFVDMDDSLQPVPSRWASSEELAALCAVLGERGRMLQIVHEFFDAGLTVSRVEMLRDLSIEHGIPTTLSPLFHSEAGAAGVERVMDAVADAWAAGARVWPQVQTRPIDISFTLAERSFMFLIIPGWWPVLSLPTKEDKIAAFRDPATRAVLVNGLDALSASPAGIDVAAILVREVASERNRELVGRSLGEIAAERATTPAELLIDLSLDEDLGTWFIRDGLGHCDPEAIGRLLASPYVHVGASDGGAHVGSFATYGDTGLLLSRFVREHGALRLEDAVKKITHDPCTIWGLPGRGLVAEGYAADLVVFDPATIDRGPEIAAHDFPGGGFRWVRRSIGVDTVLVNGAVAWTAAGGYTDQRAGRIATR